MRVLSLVPAAAEWITAFGRAEWLVREHGWPSTDPVSRLRPDVVIVDEPTREFIRRHGAACEGVRCVTFSPRSFKEVLDAALGLGRELDLLPSAMRVIGKGEARLNALRNRCGVSREGPGAGVRPQSVLILESVAPPLVAGRWAPDLIASAGGRAVAWPPDAGSRAADPDVVLIADPALDVGPSSDSAMLAAEPFAGLRGRTWLIDGRRYVNQPGPSLYRTVELIAAALYGERAGVVFQPDEMMPINDEGREA